MRVIVFFDLPTESNEDKKEYRHFRKHLLKTGFIMLQESVYCKMTLNQTAANVLIKNIREHKPEEGLVQIITITEKQFSKMEYITGEYITDIVDSDKRLIIL